MPDDTNAIELVYHGELMKNYAGQVPVGAEHGFRTLADENHHPLIFAIGSDGILRLIFQPGDRSAPWQLTTLTDHAVHRFAVAQNPGNGEIRVAYATFDQGKSELYHARCRNDRATFRSGSPFQWVRHALDPAVAEINEIEIDFEHMMFACTGGGREAFYWIAGFDGAGLDQKLELPEFGSRIIDFKVGSYGPPDLLSKGTYLLYDIGDSQTLLFQGFPGTDEALVPRRFSFKDKGRLSSIALIRGEGGEDQLVACGDSVLLYESDTIRQELIKKEEHRGRFHDIQVAQQGGHSSLWMIEEFPTQQSRLLFLTDRYFDESQQSFKKAWTSDVPFLEDVRRFACIKGSANGNHLIVLNAEKQLSHLYQDPSTTLWRRDAIAIESLDEILAFDCYTTRLILRDGKEGPPVIGQDCYVKASSQVNATINGADYRLGSEQPVCVKTDVMGALTIIHAVGDDLGTPIFIVGFDEKQSRYVLDPGHKVEERLREINRDERGARNFRAVRTDEGQPLWPKGGPSPDDGDLDHAAIVIDKLLDCKRRFLDDELAKLPGAVPAHSRPDEIWGVEFGAGGKVTYLNDKEARTKLADQDAEDVRKGGFHLIHWIGHTIGTIVHGIKSLFGELRSFIVQQVDRVTTFILNVAGKAIRFVIDTLEKVFPFLKAIFDAIGLVFKTVLHWLGRLLRWNDIWATHKMIARLTRNGTKSLEAHVRQSVPTWQADVDGYIKHLQEELTRITDEDLPDDSTKKKNRVFGIFSDLLASPLFTWPMYMLLHSRIVIREVELLTIGRIKALDDLVEQQAAVHKEVVTFVEREMGAILAFAARPDFSTRGLLRLFRPFLDEILKTVGALLQGLLGFLAEAMETLEELLGDSAKIPFVGPMYRFVTELLGEEEEYNFLNSFSLMISVPFTIFYEVFSGGRKPFENAPAGFGEPEMFDAFWKPPAPQSAGHGEAAGGGSVGEDPSTWDKIATFYQDYVGFVGCFVAIVNSAFEGASDLSKQSKSLKKTCMVLNIITHAMTIPVATAGTLDRANKRAAYGLQLGQYFLSFLPAYVVPNAKRGDLAKSIANMVLSAGTLVVNIIANVLFNPGTESWIGQMTCRLGSLVSGAGKIAGDDVYALVTGAGLSYTGAVIELPDTAPGNWGTYK